MSVTSEAVTAKQLLCEVAELYEKCEVDWVTRYGKFNPIECKGEACLGAALDHVAVRHGLIPKLKLITHQATDFLTGRPTDEWQEVDDPYSACFVYLGKRRSSSAPKVVKDAAEALVKVMKKRFGETPNFEIESVVDGNDHYVGSKEEAISIAREAGECLA